MCVTLNVRNWHKVQYKSFATAVKVKYAKLNKNCVTHKNLDMCFQAIWIIVIKDWILDILSIQNGF